MSQKSASGLRVQTRELSSRPDLLVLASHPQASLWRRRGNGLVGIGVRQRLTFAGPSRITDAANAWAAITSESVVDDEIGSLGTGLVAFGTFTFDAASALESVLVIPEFIIGHRNGLHWMTQIDSLEAPGEALTQQRAESLLDGFLAESQEKTFSTTLSPGAQSEAGYGDSVRKAVKKIRAGELNKVVLARDLTGPWSNKNPGGALRTLAESYPDCWNFSIDGLFGASPETLISVIDNNVEARVLAGTAPRGLDANSDSEYAAELASSPKEIDEHGFAVRSVVDALAPYTTALTKSDEPFTLKLPNVWHLATDISAQLTTGSSCLDVVHALHPTAAVAGNPTAAAVEVISELEPFDRGRYAGPVGWINAAGDGQWAIALRCAQISEDTITAYAGCGIVAESTPEIELAETTMKFRPIVEALDLSS